MIHVVRSYTALTKALNTPVIAPTRLATFDQHFSSCLRTFPQACDPSSNASLSPVLLNPLVYLLHARLVLHRHNLTPTCPPDVRLTAVEQCTHTALETATYLSRTTSALPEGATALLATHVFRCALFLLLANYLDQASTCIRTLAAIGTHRDVATPCLRFLAFFVSTLTSKRAEYSAFLTQASPQGAPPTPFAPPQPRPSPPALQDALLRDEELIAYVTADLQAGPETSWVWAGGEREAQNQPLPPILNDSFSPEARTSLTQDERWEWKAPECWERLEDLLRGLASGSVTPTAPTASGPGPGQQTGPGVARQGWGQPPQQQQQQQPLIKTEGPGPSPVGIMGRGGSETSPTTRSPTGSVGIVKSKNQERISIANII